MIEVVVEDEANIVGGVFGAGSVQVVELLFVDVDAVPEDELPNRANVENLVVVQVVVLVFLVVAQLVSCCQVEEVVLYLKILIVLSLIVVTSESR